MKPPDHEPTRDELLAMAYADGELDADARREFETRQKSDRDLARQVVEYHSLALMAREMAVPEPADHEWRRLETDFLQQAGGGLGWLLAAVGATGLAGWCLWTLAQSDMQTLPKVLCLSLIGGGLLLLLTTIRARLRVLPYDPYTKVKR
ncbi:MAG: hypothetical protein V3T22_10085 [Planctomycetota bacterium]